MMRLVKSCTTACALFAASGFATIASAQSGPTDPPGAFEVSGNIGLVSDYRFRGLSYSDRNPAVQGGIDVSHESGFFVGTWASSITEYGGANVEIDIYGGYGGQVSGIDYSVQALAYFYPGGSGVDYWELNGTISKTIGPASLDLALWWVPDQDNYPGDNVYISVGASVGVPTTPLTVKARVGRESNEFLKKWDWEAGVSYSFNMLTASVAYVDSNHGGVNEAGRLGRGTIVASLLAQF